MTLLDLFTINIGFALPFMRQSGRAFHGAIKARFTARRQRVRHRRGKKGRGIILPVTVEQNGIRECITPAVKANRDGK